MHLGIRLSDAERPKRRTRTDREFAGMNFRELGPLLANEPWLNNSRYIADDVTHALTQDKTFRVSKVRFSGPWVLIDAVWLGNWHRRWLRGDFFAAIAHFSEDFHYMEWIPRASSITVKLIIGSVGRKTSHGHLIRIRLVGRQIEELRFRERRASRKGIK